MTSFTALLGHAGHEVSAFWMVLSHFGHGLEYILSTAVLAGVGLWWNARRRRASK